MAQVNLSDKDLELIRNTIENVMQDETSPDYLSCWYCGDGRWVDGWESRLSPLKHDDNCEGLRLLKVLEGK